jgi:hypothetical protein
MPLECITDPIYLVERPKSITYPAGMHSEIIQVPKVPVRRDYPNLGVGK